MEDIKQIAVRRMAASLCCPTSVGRCPGQSERKGKSLDAGKQLKGDLVPVMVIYNNWMSLLMTHKRLKDIFVYVS